ncbi:hypothetical protein SCRES3_gp61 [Synechococcus phage S-CRES3]|nr:hypothetical protein SCRES3_gp61 [Synechococcus phage S-CRES3]
MKALLSIALLATTIFGSVAPALATQPVSDQEAALANQLISELKNRGITTYLDAEMCQTRNVDGFYSGRNRALVLCNDQKRTMDAELLDTLRHETVHFIQDCANGSIDGNLDLIMKPGAAQRILREHGISPERINYVYTQNGAADHVPQEYEAFAGGLMPTEVIIEVLTAVCPLP